MDDAIEGIAELLAQVEIDYALIGGHAVNVWLEPRFTADATHTLGTVRQFGQFGSLCQGRSSKALRWPSSSTRYILRPLF